MSRKRVITIGFLVWIFSALPSWAGRVDAVQGLFGATLVAGKSTTLRVYLNDSSANVDRAVVIITRPDTRRSSLVVTTADTLKIVGAGSDRSAAVTIPGVNLPTTGKYFFKVTLSYLGVPVQTDIVDGITLLPTKDLKVGVDLSWSNFGIRTGEVEAAGPALQRMAQLMPVRDGVATLGADTTSGVRWEMQVAPQPLDPQMCPFFENLAFPAARINTAIGYRFTEPGESSGGNAARYCGSFRHAVLVSYPTDVAYGFAHELGHIVGGLPDGNGDNSRIQFENWYYGYDVGKNELFNQPSSTMYGYPGNFAYHADHWERIRQGLLSYGSTGPTGALWDWSVVQTQTFAKVGVLTQQDGRRLLLMLDDYGRVYEQKEIASGSGLYGDLQLLGTPGVRLYAPFVSAMETDGRALFFARGGDGHVYYREQGNMNGTWGPWTRLTYFPVSGFTIAQNQDGRLQAFLIENGTLRSQVQWSAGWSFQTPTTLGGWGLTANVAAARNADGRLEVHVIGGDGNVYSQVQTAPNGNFGGWIDLRHTATPEVKEISLGRNNDGRLALFMIKGADKSLAVRFQTQPGGSFGEPIQLWGSSLRNLRAATVGDGRLVAFVLGGNSHLYTNFQVDPARPEVFSDFVDNERPAGLAHDFTVSVLPNGWFDVHTIDGNGQVSQGRARP